MRGYASGSGCDNEAAVMWPASYAGARCLQGSSYGGLTIINPAGNI